MHVATRGRERKVAHLSDQRLRTGITAPLAMIGCEVQGPDCSGINSGPGILGHSQAVETPAICYLSDKHTANSQHKAVLTVDVATEAKGMLLPEGEKER